MVAYMVAYMVVLKWTLQQFISIFNIHGPIRFYMGPKGMKSTVGVYKLRLATFFIVMINATVQ